MEVQGQDRYHKLLAVGMIIFVGCFTNCALFAQIAWRRQYTLKVNCFGTKMKLDFRIIQLTSSALAHGWINIRTCGKDFFPADAFGASSRVKGCGSKLCLRVKGLPKPIFTDIPTDSFGRPRWFFRERAWIKTFMRIHSLGAGSKLTIRRISPKEYEILPATGELISIASTTSMLRGMEDCMDSDSISPKEQIRGRYGKNGDLNKLSPEDRPVHDWYRFVLSFPPHLVCDYLTRFGLSSNQCILDPFCGTGTTLVECQKLGIPSIGIEANVLACFASRIKTDWHPNPDGLMKHAQVIAELAFKRLKADGIEDIPVLFAGNKNKRVKQLRTIDKNRMDLLLTDSISPLPLHKTLLLLEAMDEYNSPSYSDHDSPCFGQSPSISHQQPTLWSRSRGKISQARYSCNKCLAILC